ncbi:hypothetical protein LX36DRAFT_661793 [Colletotrichum falcatum]|nr:hypothetical protein LX36DRAFT_661793 [Colletotrichum falcatum]
MDIPQPVLRVVAVALSVGILIELAILARITGRPRELRAPWNPDTGEKARGDDEEAQPQWDNRMPPVDHTL